MFIVTNTIQVKTDQAEGIIKQFTAGHTKEKMNQVEGFTDFQLLCRALPDQPEITELVVFSQWESREQQKNWVKSESFKNMHQRKEQKNTEGSKQEKKQSGVLSSIIAEYDALL